MFKTLAVSVSAALMFALPANADEVQTKTYTELKMQTKIRCVTNENRPVFQRRGYYYREGTYTWTVLDPEPGQAGIEVVLSDSLVYGEWHRLPLIAASVVEREARCGKN